MLWQVIFSSLALHDVKMIVDGRTEIKREIIYKNEALFSSDWQLAMIK